MPLNSSFPSTMAHLLPHTIIFLRAFSSSWIPLLRVALMGVDGSINIQAPSPLEWDSSAVFSALLPRSPCRIKLQLSTAFNLLEIAALIDSTLCFPTSSPPYSHYRYHLPKIYLHKSHVSKLASGTAQAKTGHLCSSL